MSKPDQGRVTGRKKKNDDSVQIYYMKRFNINDIKKNILELVCLFLW